MVVDAASETVVRTLSDVHGSAVAVSFDGRRAYLGTDDWPAREPRPVLEWIELRNQGVGGGLTVLDLETWTVLQERALGYVNGIAVKPDDSEVFLSDHAKKALRMVDALTLEDRGLVPLGRSFPVGVGVLPDGSKAYVVCAADTTDLYAAVARRTQPTMPSAEDYFCAVVDVGTEEVVKRIPLETY
jgi:DNA-binding beta-propeller fold protein YncE